MSYVIYMILTYKIKHNRDFSCELIKARKIAEFAIRTRSRSSADVKHIGLKSAIANQILRKYSHDKKAKRVNKVLLTVPNQSIKVDQTARQINILCLKLELLYEFRNDFEKINQIELDNAFAYVSVTIPEREQIEIDGYIGVDRNATGHCVVVANPNTGKVWKLGKSVQHIHKKYSNIRRDLQKKGKYRKLKRIKNRESRILKDINHKISKKIVEIAKENNCGIRMEDLKGIRKAKSSKSFRYSLNSWSFYQQQKFVDYKAKLLGIPVVYDEPAFSSQMCSRCCHIGNRNGKEFKCSNCGHIDHADSNASFNIAEGPSIGRLHVERDACEGNADTPKMALERKTPTVEPHKL